MGSIVVRVKFRNVERLPSKKEIKLKLVIMLCRNALGKSVLGRIFLYSKEV